MYRRKKRKELYDINKFIELKNFEATIQKANQHISITGVKEVIATMQKNHQAYMKEITSFMNVHKPVLDKKYEKWIEDDSRKTICLLMFIISFIYCLFISSKVRIPFFSSIIDLVGLGAWFFGFFGAIIFKILAIISEKQYNSYYEKEVVPQANTINARYRNSFNKLYEQVDSLYLNSLEPTLRETVLMRRDQERQHRELMEAQHRHQMALEARQMALEEGQRRLQQTQDELLQIEREREERRKYGY